MFSSEAWLANPSSGFYDGVATQSLRFDSGRSTELTRSPSSASNQKKYTLSCWVKRTNLGITGTIFSAGNSHTGSPGFEQLNFTSSDALRYYRQIGSVGNTEYVTTRRFRDTSAWYHIVVMMDAVNTIGYIYVNGVRETSFSTENHPTNVDGAVNSTQKHAFGNRSTEGANDLDGYLAEVNFLDGLNISETSGYLNEFGELKNGIWIPKEYTGSYGTNGFRLQFDQTGTGTASASTIGADTSGNTNHWTSSGIVADDCNRTDSPENNFATLNPLQTVVNDTSTKPTLSNGNLVMSTSTADYQGFSSTIPIPTEGKYAFKVKMNTESSTQTHRFGVGTSVSGNGISTGTSGGASSWHNAVVFLATVPRIDNCKNGTYSAGTTLSPATVAGDEIEFLVDMDNGTIDTKLNGSAYGTQITGMPTDKPLFPFGTVYESSSGTSTLTFTFDYTPSDSAYLALCTSNLPEPTISPNSATQADDYFNIVLWTGNGSNPRTISGVGFQPDWVWHKPRNLAYNHLMWDSSRGQGSNSLLTLYPNLTNAEADTTHSQGNASQLNADGFTVITGSSGDNHVNDASYNYVTWNWKANGGTTSSNTDGSITSTVQANTTAGFSIVTYTGTDSATETVGHGLGSVPAMFIVKSRDSSSDWAVYHKGADATAPEDFNFRLNDTVNRQNSANFWNDTAPTSSVFTIGTTNLVNNTDDFITYCFAEIEGYSKFGSFVGNGNADGAMIFTSFKPAFLIIKRQSGTANNWHLWDTTRGTFNPMGSGSLLIPDDVYYESQLGSVLDILSNGFKARANSNGYNGSGVSYIYMAFAEVPFKYSLAR